MLKIEFSSEAKQMKTINEETLWTPARESLALQEKPFNSYRDPMVQEWGDWLSQYEWDLFITLTFEGVVPNSEYQVTANTGKKDMNRQHKKKKLEAKGITTLNNQYAIGQWRKLIKRMKNRQGSTPYWARVTEGTGKWENLHFHALIGGVDSVDRDELKALWKKIAGYSRILKYDPARGAAYYVSKSHGAMEFSKDLERHRLTQR